MLFIGIMFAIKNAIDIVKGIHESRVAKKRHDELIDAVYECAESFEESVIDKMTVTVYEKGTIKTDAEPLKFGD